MDIKQEEERWQKETLKPIQDRFLEREEQFSTASGIPLPVTATPQEDFDYLAQLGFPGEAPYTRGVHAGMYRGRFWTRGKPASRWLSTCRLRSVMTPMTRWRWVKWAK